MVPDFVRETFRAGTSSGGHDGEGRSARFLEWTHDPRPGESTYVVDYAFLLREDDRVSVHHDRHVEGLFSTEEWLRVLTSVGFQPSAVRHRLSDMQAASIAFVCVKPDGDVRDRVSRRRAMGHSNTLG